jgi:putative selenate reductase
MGIPGSLFFRPDKSDPFRMMRYGGELETPIGVAAGPHTQLALNIIAAWLSGARYIELKTVQTLDELEVSKPCIDMQDEGYNCEWSQELKIRDSFNEYLNAWIIIHVLRRVLGFNTPSGTLFNMSVGYNLEGILQENVQWFLDSMQDCSAELMLAKKAIRGIYPDIDKIDIPACISNHITLSTMHGCPPDEIEKIGLYLIREKKLHTTIKLNPTLLGADELRQLLNTTLGFSAVVPDLAFDHDLKYTDALKIINSLKKVSDANRLQFGIKLTNTLESINNKEVFSAEEKMMYLSGRALHPISIKLAGKLQNDLDGKLDISFSAGVDCFNIPDVIACGMKPVTVCSDLLKPGGYGRLYQYIDTLRKDFASKKAENIDQYILKVADPGTNSVTGSALLNLNRYADRVAGNPAYHKNSFTDISIKTTRSLDPFDCIHAPCIDTCPTNQDIPEYMHHVSHGNIEEAFETIFRTNPFPSVTGMVCDHLCQLKCTRINYDEALQIREIKRFVAENYKDTIKQIVQDQDETLRLCAFAVKKDVFVDPVKIEIVNTQVCPKAAIIGAGPAGLSCAWFLNQAGSEVHIFEQKNIAGGMVSAAIPSFRLTSDAIENDIQRILGSGVHLHDNYTIDKTQFEHLRQDYDAVFLAAGAQKSVRLKIDGVDSTGVIDPLEFLFDVRENRASAIGIHVVVIGGGNTAMDAARTAYRLVGEMGSVTIVYRRTIREMPADHGEIEAVRQEGINIIELVNPIRIRSVDGQVTAMVCIRNVLAMKGKDGRAIPVAIPDSEFEIPCDTIIPAIGQQLAIDFLEPDQLITVPGSYKTSIPGLYIGGDALRGASTAINAIADGRKAAEEIISNLSTSPLLLKEKGKGVEVDQEPRNFNFTELLHRKAIREYGSTSKETPLDHRRNFELIISSPTAEEAQKEASRCLLCDEICNVCVTVCPNLANFSYTIEPVHYLLQKAVLEENGLISFENDIEFHVNQPFQVLNIRDLCNECGNCTTFCPTSGRPFFDKPGIYLSVESLNEENKGFFLSQFKDKMVLVFKEKENVKTLSLVNGTYVYETDQVQAVIHPDNFNLIDVEFLTPCVKEVHFSFAAEMSIVFKGAIQLNNLLNFHS